MKLLYIYIWKKSLKKFKIVLFCSLKTGIFTSNMFIQKIHNPSPAHHIMFSTTTTSIIVLHLHSLFTTNIPTIPHKCKTSRPRTSRCCARRLHLQIIDQEFFGNSLRSSARRCRVCFVLLFLELMVRIPIVVVRSNVNMWLNSLRNDSLGNNVLTFGTGPQIFNRNSKLLKWFVNYDGQAVRRV